MRKSIPLLLAFSLVFHSSALFADSDLNQYKEESEALWRTGTGSQDGAFSAIAVSMLGWGLGLGALFAVVASALHQSTASSAHTNAHTCH
ncbi:MAG: hypothetical protein HYZ48_05725 [Chlamydiales bacterium]|nr:hypothetical protein [Chlamydiales bacterium]